MDNGYKHQEARIKRLTVITSYSIHYTKLYEALLASGHPFTALFACNDDMAMGAYRALQEAGLRIPEDVSVFGFDDNSAAAFMSPPLSTVHMPITAMTEAAFDQALKLAGGKPLAPLPPFTGAVITSYSIHYTKLYDWSQRPRSRLSSRWSRAALR